MELFLMLPGGKAGYFFLRVRGLLAVFRIRKFILRFNCISSFSFDLHRLASVFLPPHCV